MKTITKVAVALICSLFFISCEEKSEGFYGIYNVQYNEYDEDDAYSSVSTIEINADCIKWSNECVELNDGDNAQTIMSCNFDDPSAYRTIYYDLVDGEEMGYKYVVVDRENESYLFFVDNEDTLVPAQEVVIIKYQK